MKAETTLPDACRNGDREAIRRFIAAGSNLDAPGGVFAETPLQAACSVDGAADIVRDLIHAGADPGGLTTNGASPLHIASAHGQIEAMKVLIAEMADVDARCSGNEGSRPLMWAAKGGHGEAISILLDAGVEIDATDNREWTALHWACQTASPRAAEALLARGANHQAKTDKGLTALHIGCAFGGEALVTALIKGGCDKEARTAANETPLHAAANADGFYAAQTLLAHKANPLAVDAQGRTAGDAAFALGHRRVAGLCREAEREQGRRVRVSGNLADAVRSGDMAAIRDLIAAGEEPNKPCGTPRSLPLAAAAELGNADACRLIINASGDAAIRTASGRLPLHIAAGAGWSDATMVLGEHCDINALDPQGMTPLVLATLSGDTPTVQAIVGCGGDPKIAVGAKKQTALHFAAMNGRAETVVALLMGGAIVDARDVHNRAPLHEAAANARPGAASALLAAHADVNARGEFGLTALHIAASNNCPGIAAELLAYGADVMAKDDLGLTAAYRARRSQNHAILKLLAEAKPAAEARIAAAEAEAEMGG